MRISNKMITDRVLYNLSNATNRYLKLQTAASSGKRINKPSDDPIGITNDLNFRSRLANIAQFNLNISHSRSWLTFSDSALNSVNELIMEAKDVAVQLGNDTYDSDARLTGAIQIQEVFNRLMDTAGSQYQNKYIFSGSKSNVHPLLTGTYGVQYQGDYQDILIEIEKDSYLNINSFGHEFFSKQVARIGENSDLNPGLQPDMWLRELNGGSGVNIGAGQFTVNTLNGVYNIDLLGADVKNIQQLLDLINNQVPPIPNFTASIGGAGSGLNLEDTTAHHLVAVDAVNSTPLSILNGGAGVSTSPGTFVIKIDDESIVANIDISGTTNVFEAITAINTDLDAAFGVGVVSVSIDPEENKLVINDTSGIPRTLVIEESGVGQTTADDLGLIGTFQESFVGRDLEPLHIQVLESAPGETLAADLGILQNTEYDNLIGTDINPKLNYYTRLSSLNSNAGNELGIIRISNGLESMEFDLSPLQNNPNATIYDIVKMINDSGIGATATLNPDNTGIMIVSNYDDRSFTITEADDGRTASALGIFGSSDLMGNVMILQSALERNNVEEIESTLDVFDQALNQLLSIRSSVGSRVIRTDTAESIMLSQELLVTKQLSLVEDADMMRVITELTTAEIIYQSALASAARMIQPSLMDFLR